MKAEDKLTRARIQLLLNRCFYGTLALHLKLEKDNSIPTFCTDGKKIYYNEEFVNSLKDNDIEFIMAHEILHCIFYHLSRRNNREAKRWNFAVDYAVNSILYNEFHNIPEGCLYDEKYKNKTAEEIYSLLPEMNGKGEGTGTEKGDYKRYEKGDTTIEIDSKGNIKVNGKEIKQYDVHKDIKDTKENIDELEKDWKIQTTKSFSQSKIAGKLPAGMNIFIEELLQPKLNWKEMMKQFIVSISKSDYKWLPPNKKHIHRGMYLPSLTGENLGDIAIIVDNSGSTLDYQQRFFSECNSLLQQYDTNMHLLVVDTEINSYKVYNKGDSIDLKQKGGGGTDLRVAFDYIKERGINPSVVVVLTDGYTPFPEREDNPTLWVLTDGCVDFDRIPFGQKVKVEK